MTPQLLASWATANSAVVLAVLPLVWLVGRLRPGRPAERHVVWLILLVKLLTPPMWGWSIPWGNATREPTAIFAIDAPSLSFEPPPIVEDWTAVDLPPLAQPVVESFVPVETPPLVSAPVDSTWWTRGNVLTSLWIAGSLFVVVRVLIGVIGQTRLLRRTTEPDGALIELTSTVASRLGIGSVDLRVSGDIGSPFVSCLGRAIVVWPSRFAEPDAFARVEPVLAHELAHLRRRDHWVAWVELAATLAMWWNPLVWLIRGRLDETRELACDALALEASHGDRRAFAELLLSLAESGRSGWWPIPPVRTAWASSDHRALRRRLTMVFNERVRGRVTAPGWCLAGFSAMLFLPAWSLVGPQEPATDTAQQVQSEATTIVSTEPATATVASSPVVAELAVIPAAQPFGSPDELLQTLNLGGDEGVMKIYRVCPGVVRIEIERNGQKVVSQVQTMSGGSGSSSFSSSSSSGVSTSVRTSTARPSDLDASVVARSGGSPGQAVERAQVAAAASPSASVSADGGFVYLRGAEGGARVVSVPPTPAQAPRDAVQSMAQMMGGPMGAAWARRAEQPRGDHPTPAPVFDPARASNDPFAAPAPPDVDELQEQMDLAMISLEEKQAELELATRQAGDTPDAEGIHKVKIADLEVRRAQIAVSRAKRELGKAVSRSRNVSGTR